MKEPTYRQALRAAWELTGHNKMLWIFGLLAALAGQFGFSNFLGRLVAVLTENQGVGAIIGYAGFWRGWSLVGAVWLAIMGAAIGILLLVVSVIAQGAIIAAAAGWFKKKATPNLTRAWHRGAKHFWRLLGLAVLKKIILIIILIITTYVVSNLTFVPGASSFLSAIIFLALGMAGGALTSVVYIYAAGYVVEEEMGLGEAIRRGWQLLSRHLLVSLELLVIIELVTMLAIIILFMALSWFVFPFLLIGQAGALTASYFLVTLGTAGAIVVLLGAIALGGGIFNAFATSAWIYLFMHMHHNGLASRILRWFGR